MFDCNGGADWNANEGEAGFINNKPFGEIKTLIFKQENITISNQAGNGYGALNVVFENRFSYDKNSIYTVIINDKVYSNLSTNPDSNNDHLANDYTGNPVPLFTNADFTLMCSNGATYGTMYFKEPLNNGTVIIYTNVVKKIDGKYFDAKGIDKIKTSTGLYSPYEIDGEKIVDLGTVVNSIRIKINGESKRNDYELDLGDVVTSVTVNGERQTGNVDLDNYLDLDKIIIPRELDFKINTNPSKNEGVGNFIEFKVDALDFIEDNVKYLVIFQDKEYILTGKINDTVYLFDESNTTFDQYGNIQTDNCNTMYYSYRKGFTQPYFNVKKDLVDSTKPYTFSISKIINDYQYYPNYLPIVQETGDSETQIMSQKAVTDFVNGQKFTYWMGTEEDYNGISQFDENIFYFVVEESK